MNHFQRKKIFIRIFKKNFNHGKLPDPQNERISIIKRIKEKVKEFGKIGVSLYLILYIVPFAGLYFCFESRMWDVKKFLKVFSKSEISYLQKVGEKIEKANPKRVNLFTAYLINAWLVEPFRLAIVYFIIKSLRKFRK